MLSFSLESAMFWRIMFSRSTSSVSDGFFWCSSGNEIYQQASELAGGRGHERRKPWTHTLIAVTLPGWCERKSTNAWCQQPSMVGVRQSDGWHTLSPLNN